MKLCPKTAPHTLTCYGIDITETANRVMFVNLRSYHFRKLCSEHNTTHGRFLSWRDARDMWIAANYNAKRVVYGIA